MTSRSGARSNTSRSKEWKPKYPTDGYGYFEIEGHVQKVKEFNKLKADFVEFYIEKADNEIGGNYHNLSVRVPHELDVLLSMGDHVLIKGYISSIWLEEYKRTLYEMVATEVYDLKKGTIPKSEPSDEEPF